MAKLCGESFSLEISQPVVEASDPCNPPCNAMHYQHTGEVFYYLEDSLGRHEISHYTFQEIADGMRLKYG